MYSQVSNPTVPHQPAPLPSTTLCFHFVVSFSIPSPRTPGDHWSIFCLLTFAFSSETHKWNHTICSLLCMASFTLQNVLKVRTCCRELVVHTRTLLFHSTLSHVFFWWAGVEKQFMRSGSENLVFIHLRVRLLFLCAMHTVPSAENLLVNKKDKISSLWNFQYTMITESKEWNYAETWKQIAELPQPVRAWGSFTKEVTCWLKIEEKSSK